MKEDGRFLLRAFFFASNFFLFFFFFKSRLFSGPLFAVFEAGISRVSGKGLADVYPRTHAKRKPNRDKIPSS